MTTDSTTAADALSIDSARDPDNWHYVTFWPRVMATSADVIMVAALVTPVLMVIYGPGYLFDETLIEGAWHVIIGALLPAIAALWFLAHFQATPGKMMIHSQIVDQHTGDTPRIHQFIVRYLTFSVLSVPLLGLGCLWVLWDSRRQGWHDKLAGTVVLKREEWETKTR
ncbi:MAG: RDD family protein [Pseudomonadota bacterium]